MSAELWLAVDETPGLYSSGVQLCGLFLTNPTRTSAADTFILSLSDVITVYLYTPDDVDRKRAHHQAVKQDADVVERLSSYE
jgi:hypothetical protein